MHADALATLGATASACMSLKPKAGMFNLQHQKSSTCTVLIISGRIMAWWQLGTKPLSQPMSGHLVSHWLHVLYWEKMKSRRMSIEMRYFTEENMFLCSQMDTKWDISSSNNILIRSHVVKSLHLIGRWDTRKWNLRMPHLQMSHRELTTLGGAPSSNGSQWLELKIAYQHNSSSNGLQADIPYWDRQEWVQGTKVTMQFPKHFVWTKLMCYLLYMFPTLSDVTELYTWVTH